MFFRYTGTNGNNNSQEFKTLDLEQEFDNYVTHLAFGFWVVAAGTALAALGLYKTVVGITRFNKV